MSPMKSLRVPRIDKEAIIKEYKLMNREEIALQRMNFLENFLKVRNKNIKNQAPQYLEKPLRIPQAKITQTALLSKVLVFGVEKH